MPFVARKTLSTVVPVLRYRDAKKAIKWLCEAFGFEQYFVVPGENETITHAQLTFGNGMIMLGSAEKSMEKSNEFSKLMKTPEEIGGCETQSCYIIVDDADAHYRQAKAAGAQIVLELRDEFYGGREYTCRDLEGHIWSFGTYDPWQEDKEL
jgi:uncharacterized glyoxalase superfamily protein PhnB